MAERLTLPKPVKEVFKPLGLSRDPKRIGDPTEDYPAYLKAYEEAFDALAPRPRKRSGNSRTLNVDTTKAILSVWPEHDNEGWAHTEGVPGVSSQGRKLEVSGLVEVRGFEEPIRLSIDLMGATFKKEGSDKFVNQSWLSYGVILPDNAETRALGLGKAGRIEVGGSNPATLEQGFMIATKALGHLEELA